MKKDIYIIKNSVNDKVYIGQADDAAKRWLSHIYNAKYEDKAGIEKQVIHRAMSKYGIEKFHYEVLEYQIENYNEREIYWINYYDSLVPNGYNVSPGGAGSGAGIESVNSIFKDSESLLKCISEISASKKSFGNIAKKYNCSQEVISSINSGHRYRQDNFEYPLRNTDQKYSMEKVKQIRYSLKYETDLTLREIAKQYHIDLSQLSLINQGKIYYVHSESYPLRKKRKQDLDPQLLETIIDDILHSQLSLSDIAAKYNISRSRVSGINQGVIYKRDVYQYPLRSNNDSRNKSLKKFLDINTIVDIQSDLKTTLSVSSIAKKYGVSTTTIHNINNGKCKKYRLDDVEYPVRKK